MNRFFLRVFLSLSTLVVAATTFALTDPVPNPFAALVGGETVHEGQVVGLTEDGVILANEAGDEFTGVWGDIFKYREAAGPADPVEFRVGDMVRFIGTDVGEISAVQSYDLVLCDQHFYGRVSELTDDGFRFAPLDGDLYQVYAGTRTLYREEAGDLLFGYRPQVGDVLRVHGVLNTNTNEVFTETLGAYVVLLPDDALAPMAAEAAAAVSAVLDEFSDVRDETLFRAAIGFVKKQGIVSGYDDGTFRPDAEINRAEFAKILMGAVAEDDLPSLSESCFPDVPVDAWFAPYVCAAKERGVIGGYPDGTFGPTNPVNLAEALKIIVSGYDFTVDDSTEDEAWYRPFVRRAESLDILPPSFADVSDSITRGQMAELITRAVKYRRGELGEYLDLAQ